MAENVGSDGSDFNSVTSSKKSFLTNCPFADPEFAPTKSSGKVIETDSKITEILENQISAPVLRTPILSFSSPTSFDSINDEDVFRTPPENASLSSAADSEPRVRVSKLNSLSSKTETTPVSASSPSLLVETKPISDSVTEVVMSLPSPPSVAANDVRVPGKRTASDSPSPTTIGRTKVSKNQPISDSEAKTGVPKSSSPAKIPGKPLNLTGSSSGNKTSETEYSGGPLPFKEIIEALLRNSGEKLNERDEKFSYVDILKQCGLKFPK